MTRTARFSITKLAMAVIATVALTAGILLAAPAVEQAALGSDAVTFSAQAKASKQTCKGVPGGSITVTLVTNTGKKIPTYSVTWRVKNSYVASVTKDLKKVTINYKHVGKTKIFAFYGSQKFIYKINVQDPYKVLKKKIVASGKAGNVSPTTGNPYIVSQGLLYTDAIFYRADSNDFVFQHDNSAGETVCLVMPMGGAKEVQAVVYDSDGNMTAYTTLKVSKLTQGMVIYWTDENGDSAMSGPYDKRFWEGYKSWNQLLDKYGLGMTNLTA